MEFSGIMQEWVVLQRRKFRSLFLSSRKLQSYRSVQWGLYCRALSLHSAKVLKAEAAWQCHLCRLLLLGGLRAPRGVSTILPPEVFSSLFVCKTWACALHSQFQGDAGVVCASSRHLTNYCSHPEGEKNPPVFGNSAPRCCCCRCWMEFAAELDSYQLHFAPAWNFICELSFWLRSNAGQPVIFCCLALSNCLTGL